MRGVLNDVHVIIVLIFFIRSFVVGTHLNSLDKSYFSKNNKHVVGYHLNRLDKQSRSNKFQQHKFL